MCDIYKKFGVPKELVGANDFVIKIEMNGKTNFKYMPFGILYKGGSKTVAADVIKKMKIGSTGIDFDATVWYDVRCAWSCKECKNWGY